MKKVTIDDVARHAGVSKGTVSAVINEKNSVKWETRKAVLSTMKALHYRPQASARNLKKTSTEHSIGLLVRELGNPCGQHRQCQGGKAGGEIFDRQRPF